MCVCVCVCVCVCCEQEQDEVDGEDDVESVLGVASLEASGVANVKGMILVTSVIL